MNLKKRLIFSFGIPLITTIFISIFSIIPCKIGLSIPNPPTSWGMCHLNLVEILPKNYSFSYLGLTSNPFIFVTFLILILFGALFWSTKYIPFFKK